jgi:hypothetical protein
MFCVFRDAAVLWFRLHHAILLFSLRLSIKSLKKKPSRLDEAERGRVAVLLWDNDAPM